MGEYWKWRAGFALAGLIVAMCIGFGRTGDHSKAVLADARALIHAAPGYQDNPAYYDQLVDYAHQQVFKGAYHSASMSVGTRGLRSGHDDSWTDMDKYYDDLFACMIATATSAGATAAASNLEHYRDVRMGDAPPSRKATAAAEKATRP